MHFGEWIRQKRKTPQKQVKDPGQKPGAFFHFLPNIKISGPIRYIFDSELNSMDLMEL